jgi:hypothetical protein
MAESALELVRTWTRFKCFLQLVLLHFSSETNLRTVMLAASIVFTRTREEISLANS